MGLNYDGTSYGLLPYEVEMRRRLWWQIVIIDSRAAEVSGASSRHTMLTYSWTTKLPSNVNDSDLSPEMRDPPIDNPGLTEMVFVLLRYEIAHYIQEAGVTFDRKKLDEFEAYIEGRYLKYCNFSIPLHFISALTTKSSIIKLRMTPYYPRRMIGPDVPQKDKDALFLGSLEIFENHNKLLATNMVKKFAWNVYKNFPFAAFVYLLREVRNRPIGELSDRTWQAFEEAVHGRVASDSRKRSTQDSPLHLALGNLTIKAWEPREAVLQQYQLGIHTPEFIARLREEISSKKSNASTSSSTSSLTPAESLGQPMGFSWENTNFVNQSNGFDPSFSLTPDATTINWSYWGDYMQTDNAQPDDQSGMFKVHPNYDVL